MKRVLILCLVALLCSQVLHANFYISYQLGANRASDDLGDVEVDVILVSHPTYCDSLLYPDPSSAPTDGACADYTREKAYEGFYNRGNGWFSSLHLGKGFSRWRIEGSFERTQMGNVSAILPLAVSGNSAIDSKSNEWSAFDLPKNWYSDSGTTIVGMNVLYEFIPSEFARWTPYLGGGIGIALQDFTYGNEFLRKTIREGYLDVPSPVDWPDEAKANAAGTLSRFETSVSEQSLTYNLIAGFDYAIGADDTTRIGLRAGWRVIEEVEVKDILWTTIRSHSPVVADGVTPFTTDLVFSSTSQLVFSLMVTHRL